MSFGLPALPFDLATATIVDFGIWSNGFRRHVSPPSAYEDDLYEMLLADELGFSFAWISEHYAERAYIGKVDVLPLPELLMCKAAALTNRIRFGAAVKVNHLSHPVDIATQAAVADNLIGDDRYIFGFGSGFPNPTFRARPRPSARGPARTHPRVLGAYPALLGEP